MEGLPKINEENINSHLLEQNSKSNNTENETLESNKISVLQQINSIEDEEYKDIVTLLKNSALFNNATIDIIKDESIFLTAPQGAKLNYEVEEKNGKVRFNLKHNLVDLNILNEFDKPFFEASRNESVLHEELHRYTANLLMAYRYMSEEILSKYFSKDEINYAKEIERIYNTNGEDYNKITGVKEYDGDLAEFAVMGLSRKYVINKLKSKGLYNDLLKATEEYFKILNKDLYNNI